MILCIIGYLTLLFLVVEKRKRKSFVWFERKTGGQILLILFCANTIAFGLFLIDREGKNSVEIERNAYGGGNRRETYEITVGHEVKEKEIIVDVEEQKYTPREIRKIFKQVIKEMDEVILGENKSLNHVDKDLNLLTEWKEYPVLIQWELDHYEVMNVQGEIQTEKTKPEGTLVGLRGTLMYEGEQALYVTNAMVYPETKSKEEKLLSDVQELLRENEEKTKTEKVFLLPSEIDEQPINWEKKVESRGYYVLGLGMISAVLMIALKKQNEQKAQKERKEQMLTDYPEIINKFSLLLSTGMTTKSVWERIVKNYEEHKVCTGERGAYEEMRYTCNEMQSGITEVEAYERFGKRCGISVYMKFGALLAQNLKKGTKGMADLLRNEAAQAFENRKSRAKRLGEEAGTKLLAPMFGMLAIVLIIVIVPAFLSMQL